MEMRRTAPHTLFVGRGAYVAAVALAAAGLALSVLLRIEGAHRAALGSPFACTVQGTFDCEAVLASKYAWFLGLPLAIYGAFAHLLFLGLLLASRREGPAPLALAGGLSIVAGLGGITLFLVSWFAIGSLCPYCEAVHAIDVALAAILFRPARRAFAAMTRPAPLPALLLVLALCAVPAALAEYFARAWTGATRLERATPGATRWIDLSGTIALGDPGASTTVVLYLDLGCPHCASALSEAVLLLREPALRGRLRFYLKHLPLDMTCNPHTNQTLHRGACGAAHAAQAAEAFGKGAEAMAWFFEHQGTGFGELVVQAGARAVGLAPDELARRLAAPYVQAIVRRDLDEADALGVRTVPGVFVNGRFLPPGDISKEIRKAALGR